MPMLAPTLFIAWFTANPPVPSDQGGVDRQRGAQPIVGGEAVEPGDWPAVVGVNTGKICTGTLVAPDLVLTAAHCFDPEPSDPVRVFFGDNLFVAEVVLSDDWGGHPDYCLPADCGDDLHDFAWIRLPAPVNIEPVVPITSQAEFDEVMRVGVPVLLVGFGRDDDGVAGIKREVVASLVAFDESGREFRAGGADEDTCSGDSGGPALVRLQSGQWRLAGVTSRGAECGQGGIYGVPFPELCWLRDSSGIDLLPSGCAVCDCVMLAGEASDHGCGCELEAPDHGRGSRLAVELGLLLGLGIVLRWPRSRVAS